MLSTLIKYCWEWLLLILGFLYWAVAGLLITCIGNILYLLLPTHYGHLTGQFLIQKAFQCFIAYMRISGLLILDDRELMSLAQYTEGCIVAPNHIALWDAVYIIANIPDVICIMKGSILQNPFLGGGARLAGYIPNYSNAQMLKSAVNSLKQKHKLLMFPEGTRTKADALWLNPLKGGVALLAKQANVPVIPVYIRSNTRYFEKGCRLYRKPDFPIIISFNVAKPVTIKANESAQDFSARLQNMYLNELAKPHPLRRTASSKTNG